MRFIIFLHCFLSMYTQYLWPISPMQCFYGPKYRSNDAALCNVIVCWMARLRGDTLSPTGYLSGPFRQRPYSEYYASSIYEDDILFNACTAKQLTPNSQGDNYRKDGPSRVSVMVSVRVGVK